MGAHSEERAREVAGEALAHTLIVTLFRIVLQFNAMH